MVRSRGWAQLGFNPTPPPAHAAYEHTPPLDPASIPSLPPMLLYFGWKLGRCRPYSSNLGLPIIGVVAPSIQFFSQGIKLAQVHASHTQGYSACNSTTWFLSGKLFSLVHFPAFELAYQPAAGFELSIFRLLAQCAVNAPLLPPHTFYVILCYRHPTASYATIDKRVKKD